MVTAVALGDVDAVPVGDYGLPGLVGHALAGERDADDARMLELLEPFRPQRWRAMRLLLTSGAGPARRAPRARARSLRGV
jgi:3-methyladenine DNA glycosylase/8-oxoguanine DNA glycosylase